MSTNPVCIFLEEPLILPRNFLTALSDIFRSQPLISAVQPSIDVEYSPRMHIPDRAGFDTLFKLPILSGRLCAVRREHLIAAGGLDPICFALHWADLSWRLMLSSTIIHSTTEVPARMANQARSTRRFCSAVYRGFSLAIFIARWSAFLQRRLRRIVIRFRERLLRQQRTLIEQSSTYSHRALLTGLLEVSIRTAITCITLVPAWIVIRPVRLFRRKDTGLYPDTFLHSNSSGLFASRVSLNNYSLLTQDQAAYVTTLLSGRKGHPANGPHKTLSTDENFHIEQQLKKLEVLLPEVRT